MGSSFEPLKTTQPGVFGVRLCGSIGRGEKGRLRELTSRCLDNGKLRVVFDLGELEAIGGGGAAVLAQFQRDLGARGGEAVFTGVSELVQKFLTHQFTDLPLRCFADLAAAEAALAPDATDRQPETRAAEPAAPESAEPKSDDANSAAGVPTDQPAPGRSPHGGDALLDDLLGSYTAAEGGPASRAPLFEQEAPQDPLAGAAGGPAGSAPDGSDIPAAGDATTPRGDAPQDGNDGRAAIPHASPTSSGKGAVARPEFISLENALVAVRNAEDPAILEAPVCNLLRSFDLAAEVTFCARREERFSSLSGHATFPAEGPLSRALAASARPLSLLDLGENELTDEEARLLADLRADMVLPITRQGALQAAVFLRRGREGEEYGVSETFALALLVRLLGEITDCGAREAGAGGGDPAALGDLPAELRRKVRQMQALFSISEDFSRLHEAGRLMDLLCVTVVSQLGARSVALLEPKGESLAPAISRGVELERVPLLQPVTAQMRAWFADQPLAVPVGELPPLLERFRDVLAQAGFGHVAPLKVRGQIIGLLLLGEALHEGRPDFDLDFLSTLLNQAAIALDNARMFQQSQEQNIGVIRTLVSLIEQRNQIDGDITDRISHLVGQVAQEIGFPADKVRDLMFGTVLRDIGMIPISDLVLRSPRKLTDAEWRQIKAHPERGVQLLTPLQLPSTVREVVQHHHERFNGEGYPRGLQGRAIPLGARIISVVESYIAMISNLPYRAALSPAEAISILSENWGMRYDPDVVEAFLRVLAREAGEPQPETVGAEAGPGEDSE